MHVGIDISSAMDPRPSGVARYIEHLVAALSDLPDAPRLTLYCRRSRRRHGDPAQRFPGHEVRGLGRLRAPQVDVFHAPDVRMPDRCKSPTVVTLHDLSALDRSDHASPRFLKRKIDGYHRAAREADAIVTHTEAMAARIHGELDVDRERVHAVPLASALAAPSSERARDPLQLLVVGGPSTRKGAARVPRLLDRWQEQGWRPRVIWVGSATADEIEAFRSTLAGSTADRIEFRGHVDDDTLDALYRGSAALLVPSTTEGFCMPLLEAAERNCPVIAMRSAPLHEVLGDGAFWIDSDSACLWLDAGERERRSQRARERARAFTWESTAERTLAVYEGVNRGDAGG